MACRIIKKGGIVKEVYAANGEPSLLWKDLTRSFHNNIAYDIYASTLTNEYKNFGILDIEIDRNNEPVAKSISLWIDHVSKRDKLKNKIDITGLILDEKIQEIFEEAQEIDEIDFTAERAAKLLTEKHNPYREEYLSKYNKKDILKIFQEKETYIRAKRDRDSIVEIGKIITAFDNRGVDLPQLKEENLTDWTKARKQYLEWKIEDLMKDVGFGFNQSIPHEDLGPMELIEEVEKFRGMVPFDKDGKPIFSVDVVKGLIKGENLGYFTAAGNILLSTEAVKGTIYHETFHAITRKLLSPKQRKALYKEIKGLKGKATTYKNEVKSFNKFTDKEADEWLAEEFREYVLLEGKYEIGSRVKKSLIQRLFDFIYKFLGGINENKDLFKKIYTGYYNNPIEDFTTYDIKEGAAMSAKVSGAALADINQGITVSLFDIALSKGMEFSQFFQYQDSKSNLTTLLANIYGKPGMRGKHVYSNIRGSLENQFRSIKDRIKQLEAKGKLTDKDKNNLTILREDLKTVYTIAEAVRLNWNDFINYNMEYLAKFKFNIPSQAILDELDSQEDEKDGNDSLYHKNASEVNPVKTLNPSVKLLLSTLPETKWKTVIHPEGTHKELKFVKTKYGVNKLTDYGQVLATLYKNLSNKSTVLEMLLALENLAKENATYRVLLNRLGLYKHGSKTSYDTLLNQNLSKQEFSVLLAFLNNFSKSANTYNVLNVNTEGRRNLVNSNKEQYTDIIKQRWAYNFRTLITQTGVGTKSKKGRYILNLNAKVSLGKHGTKTLGGKDGWFLDSKRDTFQDLALLESIGINFTNKKGLLKMLEDYAAAEKFSDIVNWIFGDLATEIDPKTKKTIYLKEKEIASLFDDSDLFGRLSELIDFEAMSTKQAVTLQHRFNNKQKYGITSKNHLNVIVDHLNEDPNNAEILLNHPNLMGSLWLSKSAKGQKFNIINIEGVSDSNRGRSTDTSKLSKSDIANIYVNNLLEGNNIIIRTGNKKSEFAINVGTPSYNMSEDVMVNTLKEYLISEILTANKITKGDANNIAGLKENGKRLQFFNHPEFSQLQAMVEKHIKKQNLRIANLDSAVLGTEVDLEIRKFLRNRQVKVLETFFKHNILYQGSDQVTNIGINFDTIAKIAETLPVSVRNSLRINKNEAVRFEMSKKNNTYAVSPLLDRILQQYAYLEIINMVEQSKIFLGHPALYNELFKRTSGLSSPKDMVISDPAILKLLNKFYPNYASKNADHRDTVRTIVRDELVTTSRYKEQYLQRLQMMGVSPIAMANVNETYTNMKIFDGGGLAHIDFYRRVRILTNNWGPREENAYLKVIDPEKYGALKGEDISILTPIKPQVFASFVEDNIWLKKFDKFSLFPVHPNLSKTILNLENNQQTLMDQIFVEMTNNDLDYITFPSSTKAGAKMNSKGEFDPLLKDNQFVPLSNLSALTIYSLSDFGIQIKPPTSISRKVTVGTQLFAGLPVNVYSNGQISPKYANVPFSEEETWEDAINRYHRLQNIIINKEVALLANKLGFVNIDGNFKTLDKNVSKDLIRNTLIQEMTRRELTEHTKDAILKLFDSPTTFINQLYQKNKIETLLYSIITNTVIKRKMTGTKVAIQNRLGFTEALQEGINLGMNNLEFYRVDPVTGKTLPAQILLPASYIGQLEPGQVIKAVAFRIPTEPGFSSAEVYEVAGFLPEEYDGVAIVPDEMVAKAGADYDGDSLTMYLYNEGSAPLEGNPLQHITRLRNTDINSYRSIAIQLLSQNKEQDTITFLSNLDKAIKNNDSAILDKLDQILLNLGFDNLPNDIKQSKAVTENELLDLMSDIILHPLNFDELIEPVGAFQIKEEARSIRDRKEQTGLLTAPSNELFDMLSLDGIVESSYQMWQTLGGVGVLATGGTNQVKSQRAAVTINTGMPFRNIFGKEQNFKFNFQGIDNSSPVPIGRSLDITGVNKITSTLRQYMTAYVDGEKDPFAMDINAGLLTAGVHVLLARIGLPQSTVVHFMSQPIISEFIELKNKYQGAHSYDMQKQLSNAYLTDIEIIRRLVNKYGRNQGSPIPLSLKVLKDMVALPLTKMNDTQKDLQLQILNDFINYKKIAEGLRKLQTITSPDTTRLKNGHEVIYLQALENLVQQTGYFNNISGILGIGIGEGLPITASNAVRQQNSMLTPLRGVFKSSKSMMEDLDFKTRSDKKGASPIYDKFVTLTARLINENKSKEDILYILQAFDNHLTSYILQTATLNDSFPHALFSKYGDVKINTLVKELFQGTDKIKSLPARIVRAKKKHPGNSFLRELLPQLQEYIDDKNFDYTIDKLQLASKRHNNFDLNYFAQDVENLFEEDPELVLDIYLYSLLKSGTSFSPTSFFQALPETLLLPITEKIFNSAKIKLDAGKFNQLIDTIYEDFLDNSWDNSRIVPTQSSNYKRSWDGRKLWIKETYSGERILIKERRPDVRKKGLYDQELYYDHLYKFVGTRKEKTGPKKGKEVFIYEKIEKKGERHNLVEAGTNTNLNKNSIFAKPYPKIFLNEQEELKLYTDRRVIIKRKKKVTNGQYQLKDGQLIDLKIIKETKTGVTYSISFQAFQTEETIKSTERPSDQEIEATGTALEDLKIRKVIKDTFEDNENACKK